MQGLTMDLQIITSILVGGTILYKILWEAYRTFVKQRMRKGLLKLNWTFRPRSKRLRPKSFDKYKIEDNEFSYYSPK